jgi:hypothetical protein
VDTWLYRVFGLAPPQPTRMPGPSLPSRGDGPAAFGGKPDSADRTFTIRQLTVQVDPDESNFLKSPGPLASAAASICWLTRLP